MHFDGAAIRQTNYSGTYQLERVGISAYGQYVGYDGSACHTCSYKHTDFEYLWVVDLDGDGDVDGSDLAAFAAAFNESALPTFAAEFGRTDCL